MKRFIVLLVVFFLSGCASTTILQVGEQNSRFNFFTFETEPGVFELSVEGPAVLETVDSEAAFIGKAEVLCGGSDYEVNFESGSYTYYSSGGGYSFSHNGPVTYGTIRCPNPAVSVFAIPDNPLLSTEEFLDGDVARLIVFRHEKMPDLYKKDFFLDGKRIARLRTGQYSVFFLEEGEYILSQKDGFMSTDLTGRVKPEVKMPIELKKGETFYAVYSFDRQKILLRVNEKYGYALTKNLSFTE